MKRFSNKSFLSYLALGAATLLSACSEDADFTGAPETKITGVTITAPDFIADGDLLTRTEINISQLGAEFLWQADDLVGIYPDEGTQVRFPMENGAGSSTAKFDGGGWAVKGAYSYMAYYPFIPDMNMDKRAIPVDFTGQCQYGSNNHQHIGRYDYMTASHQTPTADGNVGFSFKHMGALVRLTIPVPKPNSYSEVIIHTEADIPLRGILDITRDNISIEVTESTHDFVVKLDHINTVAANEEIIVFFMLPPVDLSKVDTYVQLRSSDALFEGLLTRKNYEAGHIYAPDIVTMNGNEINKLLPGEEFNAAIKSLVDLRRDHSCNHTDYIVKKIAFKTNSSYRPAIDDPYSVDVSSKSCVDPIYAVWDPETETVTIHSDKEIILADYYANGMFQKFEKLESIDLTGLSTFDTGEMNSMFNDCQKLNSIDLSGFETSKLQIAGSMFQGCHSLQSVDMSMLNTTNLHSIDYIFNGCNSLESFQLKPAHEVSMMGAFQGCSALKNIDVEGWKLGGNSLWSTFEGCSSLTTLDVSSWDFSLIEEFANTFNDCENLETLNLGEFNTANATTFYATFGGLHKLNTLNLGNICTDKVTDFTYMFIGCSSLESLDVSGFNTSNAELMQGTFGGCESLTSLDVTGFNTSNVSSMAGMFGSCKSLSELDLTNFNTENVRYMERMFEGSINLTSLDLSSFNVPKVETLENMFGDCTKLENITFGEKFSPEECEVFGGMFANCISLKELDLSMFSTESAKGMWSMFDGCTSLESITFSDYFTTHHCTTFGRMFLNCNKLQNLDLSSFTSDPEISVAAEEMFLWCNDLETINFGAWIPPMSIDWTNFQAPKTSITCTPELKESLANAGYTCEGITFYNFETGEEM